MNHDNRINRTSEVPTGQRPIEGATVEPRAPGAEVGPSADPARRPSVLLVVDDGVAPIVALARAASLARALDGDLHALAVVRKRRATPSDVETIRGQLARRLADLHEPVRTSVDVRIGTVKGAAIAAGRERDPAVIVLSPTSGGRGRTAVAIADAVRTPVLLARDARPDGAVLAATDMRDPLFPVLTASHEIARALGRRATYVHNAAPVAVYAVDPVGAPLRGLELARFDEDVANAKLARLRQVAHHGGNDVDAVVVRERGTVDAILAQAREHDADVISVGLRPSSRLKKLLGSRITQRLADRSRRSVLIVPIERVTAPGAPTVGSALPS